MTDGIYYQINEKYKCQTTESSSNRLLCTVEDLSNKPTTNSSIKLRVKYLSKSFDDLRNQKKSKKKEVNDDHVSTITRTEMNLSIIGCDNHGIVNENDFPHDDDDDLQLLQQSKSAPASPTKFDDKELAAFIQCEEQQHQQYISNSFIYNIDLSDMEQMIHHQPHSRVDMFLDDDYDYSSSNNSFYRPTINNLMHSSLINNCLTITEENEEELEQLERDNAEEERKSQNHILKLNDGSMPTATLHDNDDRADILDDDGPLDECNIEAKTMTDKSNSEFYENCNDDEGLSTIYESPNPEAKVEEDIYDDAYDRLIVYDIANTDSIDKSLNTSKKSDINSSSTSTYRSPIFNPTSLQSCYADAALEPCTASTKNLSASSLCGTTTSITSKVFKPPSQFPVINTRKISINKSLVSLPIQELSPAKPSPISLSVPMLLIPATGTTKLTTHEQNSCMIDKSNSIQSEYVKKMKVIQSSSSSLSDFVMPESGSTLKSALHYEEVPSVHHSLTDCSTIRGFSCCAPISNEDSTNNIRSSNENQRRPSFTRRILTNGLLLPHCSNSNAAYRRNQPPLTFNQFRHPTKPKSEEKLSTLSSPSSSSSSSSSNSNSPPGDKFMSRSDFLLQQQQELNLSQQRKAMSLKTIAEKSNQSNSKILYPIDFETNNIDHSWYKRHSNNKVPTSDSGIVIDTAGTLPTSKSSIADNDADGITADITNSGKLKQYENNYRKILNDLTIIKKNIVGIESRLSETMREFEIERALVEGEHELVFKQILDASQSDQDKIRNLYDDLQLLIERVMAEKTSIRQEIDYTQQTLFKLEDELRELKEQYRPSDDKILKKKEIIAETRKKHEDLEFQLMELETRCEAELEQAEEHFQKEQVLVTQNAQVRQNTLRDLDQQQNTLLQQIMMEKEKLEREKQKLKLLFKQKKLEANQLEQKINDISLNHHENHHGYNVHQYQTLNGKVSWLNGTTTVYHSTPSNLYSPLNYNDDISSSKINMKENQNDKLNEIKDMIVVAKLEKMTLLEEQLRERYNELVHCNEEHVNHIEADDKVANDIQTHEFHHKSQVKLREKSRMQERPLTRYLPVRSLDFDLRAHIEGAGHLINSQHVHITSTSCRGFLLKMGGMKFKTWNRRWFVFDRKRRSLFYYQDKTEAKLRGCIYFQSIVEVYVDHLQSISLRSPEPREATFIVKTVERPYYLVAPNVESMRIWVDVIITGAEGNTFAGEG